MGAERCPFFYGMSYFVRGLRKGAISFAGEIYHIVECNPHAYNNKKTELLKRPENKKGKL
jgi:hypothetical protein